MFRETFQSKEGGQPHHGCRCRGLAVNPELSKAARFHATCRLKGFSVLCVNIQKKSWRRKRQPTPVFLPGESHGWRSLVGYSPTVAEWDTTERLHFHFHFTLPLGFRDISVGEEPTCNAGDPGSIPGSGRSPGEGIGLPTPVFWPGEFHGLSSRKESDTTE